MLEVQNVTYTIGGRTLLNRASLNLPLGHHAALVGRNGAGKTTLFRLILGKIHQDNGEIYIQNGLRVGTVSQETPAGDATPLSFLLDSDKEYKDLMAAAETETDPNKIGEIHARLGEIHAYSAPARAAKLLKGLGFSDADQLKPLESFSGGWRKRVALGAILFLAPDILMLDEPSNHLDLEATIWLTQHLKSYSGTILLISHDKHIINAIVDRVYHLNQQQITLYMGDYDSFQEKRMEKALQMQAQMVKQQAQKAHMQQFIDRFRAKTSKARMVQSRIKQLSKMEEVQMVADDPSIPLKFPKPAALSPPLISLENVSVGYGDKVILKNLNQRIDPGDSIALLGRNGNGKTTFARAIAGTLDPMGGARKVYQDFSVGFFQQHQLEMLNPGQTAFEHMTDAMRGVEPSKVRAFLGRFGFTSDKANIPAKNLSGGEKTRLNFALLCNNKPSLLILDEPTNHLDIEAREALVLGLNQYDGAVILVTHDWDLLSLTATKLWTVGDQTVKPFDGTLEDYQREVLGIRVDKKVKDKSRAAEIKAKKQKKKDKGPKPGGKKGKR